MTLIVETGEGVQGANSYVDRFYANTYLTARNKATTWEAASAEARAAALIEATSYIDLSFGHRFKGVRQFTAMDFYAYGFLSFDLVPTADDTITVGETTYTFKASASLATEITIDASAVLTAAATVTAINANSTDVSAAVMEDTEIVKITAVTAGTDGNALALTSSNESAIRTSAAILTGGREPGTQPLEFPRAYLYDPSGIAVDGIPEGLKMATVEYASRAISASLLPDPTYDANGRLVTRESKKVGPIETETRWTEGGDIIVDRKYPFADRMLRQYLTGAGGVTR